MCISCSFSHCSHFCNRFLLENQAFMKSYFNMMQTAMNANRLSLNHI